MSCISLKSNLDLFGDQADVIFQINVTETDLFAHYHIVACWGLLRAGL